jgi:predicted metal-dependent HD superfamily phosphohydrolase
MTDNMFDNWQRLLELFGIERIAVEKTYMQIVEDYSTPGRHYHNLAHIQQVLATIQSLETQVRDLPALLFATWFHDIIYNTQAANNEENSAEYARELLTLLNIPNQTIVNACRLILSTEYHQAKYDDFDNQLLIDADLAILGSSRENYREYMQAIRQEYAWVPKKEYIVGRKRILEGFLQRPRIYLTEELSTLLEVFARENIQAEIEFLDNI